MALLRWVYKQLWGKGSEWSHVQSLVERGIMQVDGPPPDGSSRWSSRELDHGITHLEGHRHVLF